MSTQLKALKKYIYKLGFGFAMVSSLVLANAPAVSALQYVDGKSFSDCPGQTIWGTYYIHNSSFTTLGYMRVYSCQDGFFVRTSNTIGSAYSTTSVITRYNSSHRDYLVASGKYASVTNQLTKYTGYCFQAHGYISTAAYRDGYRDFTFLCQ